MHSESYHTAREALNRKLYVKAAKKLAKTRLEKATKKKKKNDSPGGDTDSN